MTCGDDVSDFPSVHCSVQLQYECGQYGKIKMVFCVPLIALYTRVLD